MVTEIEMSDIITEALYDAVGENDAEINVSSFSDIGLLTNNEGIIVKLWDGSEFKITIVQSGD